MRINLLLLAAAITGLILLVSLSDNSCNDRHSIMIGDALKLAGC